MVGRPAGGNSITATPPTISARSTRHAVPSGEGECGAHALRLPLSSAPVGLATGRPPARIDVTPAGARKPTQDFDKLTTTRLRSDWRAPCRPAPSSGGHCDHAQAHPLPSPRDTETARRRSCTARTAYDARRDHSPASATNARSPASATRGAEQSTNAPPHARTSPRRHHTTHHAPRHARPDDAATTHPRPSHNPTTHDQRDTGSTAHMRYGSQHAADPHNGTTQRRPRHPHHGRDGRLGRGAEHHAPLPQSHIVLPHSPSAFMLRTACDCILDAPSHIQFHSAPLYHS